METTQPHRWLTHLKLVVEGEGGVASVMKVHRPRCSSRLSQPTAAMRVGAVSCVSRRGSRGCGYRGPGGRQGWRRAKTKWERTRAWFYETVSL
eukprot:scaffold13356_cov179-Alexandrium_tamarense.AAC.10